MRRELALVILLGLVAPTASASQISAGQFVSQGPILLPDDVPLSADARVMWLPTLEGAGAITLRAPRGVIHRFEYASQDAGTLKLQLEDRSASYAVGAMTVTIQGDPDAWLGIVGERLDVDATSRAEQRISVAGTAKIGNEISSSPAAGDNLPAFGQAAPSSTLLWNTRSVFDVRGDGALKIMGAPVRIETSRNDTTYETGFNQSGGPLPTQKVSRWFVIEFEEGELTMQGAVGSQLFLTSLDAAQLARVSLTRATGTLVDADARRDATNKDITLTGELSLSLSAAPATTGGIAVQVSGELASASGMTTVPLPNPWPGRTLFLLVFLVGLALAGGAGALIAKKRNEKAEHRLTLDQVMDLANEAAEGQRFALALEWNARAQQMVKPSARLKTDEGFFRAATGDIDGALTAYDAASSMDTTGEADFLAANLLVSVGDHARAEAYLVRALARTPSLVFEVEDDPQFKRMIASPEIANAIEKARRLADAE